MTTSHNTVSSAARRRRFDDVNPLLWVVLSLFWVGTLISVALGQYAMTLLIVAVGAVSGVVLTVPGLINVQTIRHSLPSPHPGVRQPRRSRAARPPSADDESYPYSWWDHDTKNPMSIWYDPD